jgi:hypothetical protein
MEKYNDLVSELWLASRLTPWLTAWFVLATSYADRVETGESGAAELGQRCVQIA